MDGITSKYINGSVPFHLLIETNSETLTDVENTEENEERLDVPDHVEIPRYTPAPSVYESPKHNPPQEKSGQ